VSSRSSKGRRLRRQRQSRLLAKGGRDTNRKHLKYCGWSQHDRRGLPDGIAPPDGQVIAYLNRLNPAISRPYLKAIKNSVFRLAGPTDLYKHLDKYDRKDFVVPKKYEAHFQLALDEWREEIISRGAVGSDIFVEDLEGVSIQGSTHPGRLWRRRNYRTKAEAAPLATLVARSRLGMMLSGLPTRDLPVAVGGRGKLTTSTDGPPTQQKPGRMIAMPETDDVILLGLAAQPLTRFMMENDDRTALGKTFLKGGSANFVEAFDGFDRYLCDDLASFDASVNTTCQRMVFTWLRGWITNDGPEWDEYWEYCARSMRESDLCMPDGHRFRRYTGSCTGNPFNSLVQSIIRVCSSLAVLESIRPGTIRARDRQWKINALGDDQVLALRGELANVVDLDRFSHRLLEGFGFLVAKNKSFQTRTVHSKNYETPDGVKYLGKVFVDGLAGRPTEETILRLAFPEFGKYELNHSYERAIGNYIDAATNPQTRFLLDGLMNYLEKKNAKSSGIWPDWARKHIFREYTFGLEVSFPFRRFTWEETLELYETNWGNNSQSPWSLDRARENEWLSNSGS